MNYLTEKKITERRKEVSLQWEIEFRCIGGVSWRLWTVNNSFIIPIQEIRLSWGKHKEPQNHECAIKHYLPSLWSGCCGRAFFGSLSKYLQMSKLKFSKIKNLEVNPKKVDVYGFQQLNLTACYDGFYFFKKIIYYHFVSQISLRELSFL